MSSYYFIGQTAIGFSGSTGTFSGSVTIGGTLAVSGTTSSTGQFLAANGTAAAPGFAFTNATGTGVYRPSANAFAVSTNGTNALTIANNQVATFASTVNANALMSSTSVIATSGQSIGWSSSTKLNDSSTNGNLTVWNNANTDFGLLQFGGTSSSFPALKRSTTTLKVRLADDSADATITASAATLSAATALTLSNAAPAVNSTAATTNLLAFQNNGTGVTSLDLGGYLVPATIDPSTYYFAFDFDTGAVANFIQAGTTNMSTINSLSGPLVNASNMGIALAETTSSTAGGYIGIPAGYPIIKSASINYQWRIIFYLPAASTSANRYVASVGGMNFSGAGTHAGAVGQCGPYISYSDNLNSGNWQMNSAVNGTITSGNSSTAPTTGAWNTLLITLANGVYTFTVNGTQIGTLTDSNITTSPANQQCVSAGGIAILPDGSNFTTARQILIDRCDFYVTGLTR